MNEYIIGLLSRQYYHELSNSLKYQRIAHNFILIGLTGIAKFLNKQACGEHSHAQKVLSYIKDRLIPLNAGIIDGEITIQEIELIPVFTEILAIEQNTTAMLIELNAQAIATGDILTSQWLYDSDGLLKEQIEEEYIIKLILKKIENRMLNDNASGGINYDIDMWIEQEFNK